MQGIFTSGTWEEKSDEIFFADFKFSVTHHYLVQEPTDKEGKDEVLEGRLFFNTYFKLLTCRIDCHFEYEFSSLDYVVSPGYAYICKVVSPVHLK